VTNAAVRASFHDPDGSVFLTHDKVLRRLTGLAAERLDAFLSTPLAQALLLQGRIPATLRLDANPASPCSPISPGQVCYQHERLPFINYPHEWLPEQLQEAGLLSLEIAQQARAQGWDLKDGNARNVVFRGARPVFVDLGSFVPSDDSQPVWRPAGQLQRHVLLPLLLQRHRHWPTAATLLARPDGLAHGEAWSALRGSPVLDRDVFWLCALPTWLAAASSGTEPAAKPRRFGPDVARAAADHTVRSLLRRLRRMRLGKPAGASQWAGYEQSRSHYPGHSLELKRQAVEAMLRRLGPGTLLDIGTNGGEYSNLAASLGHQVVAIDSDADALSQARRRALDAGLDVLHLLVDFSAPTPALGWNGVECLSFNSRCTGAFDTVMALAVVHHVLVLGGIPLDELIQRLAQDSRRHLIIEYVDPRDPMFSALARQRGLDLSWLDVQRFESELSQRFAIDERVEIVPTHRILYRCSRL
jgi:SAM-dependent methyltransferase